MTIMAQFFWSFWWLIFPVGGMAFAAFQSWLKYRQQKALLDLIRTYAQTGAEPPEALLRQLDRPLGLNGSNNSEQGFSNTPTNYWSLFGLFAFLAAGFGIAALMGVDRNSGAFVIVGVVMAAVAVWALINAVLLGRSRS
jgi:hypothetical protein